MTSCILKPSQSTVGDNRALGTIVLAYTNFFMMEDGHFFQSFQAWLFLRLREIMDFYSQTFLTETTWQPMVEFLQEISRLLHKHHCTLRKLQNKLTSKEGQDHGAKVKLRGEFRRFRGCWASLWIIGIHHFCSHSQLVWALASLDYILIFLPEQTCISKAEPTQDTELLTNCLIHLG